jgi:hypothetical protein
MGKRNSRVKHSKSDIVEKEQKRVEDEVAKSIKLRQEYEIGSLNDKQQLDEDVP